MFLHSQEKVAGNPQRQTWSSYHYFCQSEEGKLFDRVFSCAPLQSLAIVIIMFHHSLSPAITLFLLLSAAIIHDLMYYHSPSFIIISINRFHLPLLSIFCHQLSLSMAICTSLANNHHNYPSFDINCRSISLPSAATFVALYIICDFQEKCYSYLRPGVRV